MGGVTLDGTRRLLKLVINLWEEIRHDDKKKVLFVRQLDPSSEVRRIVVYYTRNVLSVVTRNVEDGNRFFYKSNCDLIDLGRLLETPSLYKTLGFKQNEHCIAPPKLSSCHERRLSLLTDDEDDLEDHLNCIERQLKELNEYCERVKAKVTEDKEKKKKNEEQMMRSFVTQDVLSELHSISMPELVCLTLTPDGKGVVYAEKSGQSYWTCPIDWNLGEKLRTSSKDHYPLTINLGSSERYFVRFSDDKQIVNGNEELKELVDVDKVKMVAFGGTFNSFVVLYEDGGTAWSYIPRALRRALSSHGPNEPKAEFVSLGAGGAYFVRFGDNVVQYGNISVEMKKALENCPGTIKEVTYGAGNSLIARYTPT